MGVKFFKVTVRINLKDYIMEHRKDIIMTKTYAIRPLSYSNFTNREFESLMMDTHQSLATFSKANKDEDMYAKHLEPFKTKLDDFQAQLAAVETKESSNLTEVDRNRDSALVGLFTLHRGFAKIKDAKLIEAHETLKPVFAKYKDITKFDEKGWSFLEREVALDELNNEFIRQLDLLIELLEIYLSYLDYLDFDIQRIEASPTALDAISDLSNSSVLNFNYTNTSSRLYGTSEEKTHFIHGRIDLDRTFSRINTMVFGIEDKEINVNSDLIPYQKYYQRVVKETGKKFEDFFCIRNLKKRDIPGSNLQTIQGTSKNIVVFGHSVDPLDKEIFQKCFELTITRKYNSRFIFTYFDEQAKRSIIKNLAIILGKEKLIELTGKQKIVFIKSDDKDGMKDVLLP